MEESEASEAMDTMIVDHNDHMLEDLPDSGEYGK